MPTPKQKMQANFIKPQFSSKVKSKQLPAPNAYYPQIPTKNINGAKAAFQSNTERSTNQQISTQQQNPSPTAYNPILTQNNQNICKASFPKPPSLQINKCEPFKSKLFSESNIYLGPGRYDTFLSERIQKLDEFLKPSPMFADENPKNKQNKVQIISQSKVTQTSVEDLQAIYYKALNYGTSYREKELDLMKQKDDLNSYQ